MKMTPDLYEGVMMPMNRWAVAARAHADLKPGDAVVFDGDHLRLARSDEHPHACLPLKFTVTSYGAIEVPAWWYFLVVRMRAALMVRDPQPTGKQTLFGRIMGALR